MKQNLKLERKQEAVQNRIRKLLERIEKGAGIRMGDARFLNTQGITVDPASIRGGKPKLPPGSIIRKGNGKKLLVVTTQRGYIKKIPLASKKKGCSKVTSICIKCLKNPAQESSKTCGGCLNI